MLPCLNIILEHLLSIPSDNKMIKKNIYNENKVYFYKTYGTLIDIFQGGGKDFYPD